MKLRISDRRKPGNSLVELQVYSSSTFITPNEPLNTLVQMLTETSTSGGEPKKGGLSSPGLAIRGSN